MSEHQNQSPVSRPTRPWVRSLVPAAVAALAVAGGGVVAASQEAPASAAPRATGTHLRVVADPLPAAGKSWIQGVVTDQANHPLDNVNVEVWSTSPTAGSPVGSNLTYAGTPADSRHQHGVFRVEVPTNESYVIVFSAVGKAEDGDHYRMQRYGKGRPVAARPGAGAGGRAAAGRVVDLGKVQLVHQGHVKSTTTVKLAKKKVPAGQRARVTVRVKSPYVSAPAGKLTIHVDGKKLTHRLHATDHGRAAIRLPRIKKSGQHRVTASFATTSTVAHSASKPVRFTVK